MGLACIILEACQTILLAIIIYRKLMNSTVTSPTPWTLRHPFDNSSLYLSALRNTTENLYRPMIRSHRGLLAMVNSREKIKCENYLETTLRMMIWTGLNRPLSPHPIVNALFIFRVIFVVVTYVVLIIGCVLHIRIVNKYDLLLSSMNILQLIVYIIGLLHIGYYQIKNGAVHCLVTQVRQAFRSVSNTGHFAIDEQVRVDTRRSVGWTVLCIAVVISWFALAIAQGDDPIPVWAPVNLRESPYYEIDTFLQFTAQFMIGSIGGCFGSFYMSLLSLYKYQFDILSCSLEHMAPLAVLRMRRRIHDGSEKISGAFKTQKNYSPNRGGSTMKISHQCECCTEEFTRFFEIFEKRRFNNDLTPLEIRLYEEELHDILKDCIVHHQGITKLKDAVDDFFGPIMLIRFILSTLLMCFIIYSSSKFTANGGFSLTDMRVISLVEYYVTSVGELFIFCSIADHLLRASITIPDVAFEKLPWHGGSVTKKFISTWKIFHLVASKPTSLRTPFYVVSLNILGGMLRSSFSFYTLLRRMQNN